MYGRTALGGKTNCTQQNQQAAHADSPCRSLWISDKLAQQGQLEYPQVQPGPGSDAFSEKGQEATMPMVELQSLPDSCSEQYGSGDERAVNECHR